MLILTMKLVDNRSSCRHACHCQHNFWKAGDAKPYATIKSVGIGQDAKAHHWLAIVWLFGVFALALGFVAYSSQVVDGKVVENHIHHIDSLLHWWDLVASVFCFCDRLSSGLGAGIFNI